MAPTFDVARFETLKEELKLLKGPPKDWSHLSMGRERPPIPDGGLTPEQAFNPDTDEETSDNEGPPSGFNLDNHERKDFILDRIIRDLYSLARESEQSGCTDFQEILPELEKVIHKAVGRRCAGKEEDSMSRSLAHSKEYPLVRRKRITNGLDQNMYNTIERFRRILMKPGESEDESKIPKRTPPWSESFRPHPLSTPLSRFRDSVEVTATPNEASASAVYSARCEILGDAIALSCMTLSPNCEILLQAYNDGYKGRSSTIQLHLLGRAGGDIDMPPSRGVLGNEPGHSDRITHVGIEETRSLIFSADTYRIKSFRWDVNDEEDSGAVPVHTFDSKDWDGPLTTLASGEGKVIRAGKGSAGIWKLDTAPTHGDDGTELIGEEFSIDGTWRDDPEEIELSGGSPPDGKITFQDHKFVPGTWHPDPSQNGIMLAGEEYEQQGIDKGFSFVSIDLETGKFVTRYLGHGGGTTQISTVPGQAQTFVTSCLDGFVRLWDTRMVLPALTISTGSDPCMAAAYANPDGIPTIFTGATHGEHIRLWDVRARTPVYDLSTGNNAVESLAWDHQRNHLWAATIAESAKDNERRHLFFESDDEDWDNGPMWPTTAYHWEDYFGAAYNSGGGQLFRYAFKEDPNINIHP